MNQGQVYLLKPPFNLCQDVDTSSVTMEEFSSSGHDHYFAVYDLPLWCSGGWLGSMRYIHCTIECGCFGALEMILVSQLLAVFIE